MDNIEMEEEFNMSGYAIKSDEPFISKKKLVRTPTSKENKDRRNYINSHNFSFEIDSNTKELKSSVSEKK